MPRNLAPLFQQETAATEQSQLLHLITVVVSPTESLRLVDSNYDITYNGELYVRFPLKFSGISVSTDGSIDKASIIIANVTGDLMSYLQTYKGLGGHKVYVKTIYEKFVDFTYSLDANNNVTSVVNPNKKITADYYTEDEYVIDSYVANETTITFQLDPAFDSTMKIPRRRFTPYSCYWRFLSTECGYVIPEGMAADDPLRHCSKDLAGCIAHNNSGRFGGFPGIPSVSTTRRIIL